MSQKVQRMKLLHPFCDHPILSVQKLRVHSFVESGSRIELNCFSMRLINTAEKEKDTDKGTITKRNSGRVPKTRQKQMVTKVSNLEEKRTLDIGNTMTENDISEVMP
ncbi:hypothetical protein KI387_016643, partial [Taxus chinensis]